MEKGKLTGKKVIITGGASGIGKASVQSCCREGAEVIFLDLDQQKGESLQSELRQSGMECTFIKADVTNEEDWINVAESIADKYGKIDALFNNAGTNVIKPVTDLLESEWDRTLSVNLKSIFLGVKHILPILKDGAGSIVSTASSFGLIGRNNMAAYCASKGGVIALTRELALECAGRKIRVNCISPGPTLTELLKGNIERGFTDKKLLLSSVPFDRFAEPSEIGSLLVYLISDDSKFVTGSNVVIDGGQTIA